MRASCGAVQVCLALRLYKRRACVCVCGSHRRVRCSVAALEKVVDRGGKRGKADTAKRCRLRARAHGQHGACEAARRDTIDHVVLGTVLVGPAPSRAPCLRLRAAEHAASRKWGRARRRTDSMTHSEPAYRAPTMPKLRAYDQLCRPVARITSRNLSLVGSSFISAGLVLTPPIMKPNAPPSPKPVPAPLTTGTVRLAARSPSPVGPAHMGHASDGVLVWRVEYSGAVSIKARRTHP
jgi:hypothetical protein